MWACPAFKFLNADGVEDPVALVIRPGDVNTRRVELAILWHTEIDYCVPRSLSLIFGLSLTTSAGCMTTDLSKRKAPSSALALDVLE